MKAFMLDAYGGPEVCALRDIPQPMPGPGEVLIKVAGAGLNPVDYKIRDGDLKRVFKLALPTAMGSEVSGTVITTGPAVSGFQPGDRVCGRQSRGKMGTFAEGVCISAGMVAKVPEDLPLVDMGSLPLAGLTALQAVRDTLGAAPGKHLLITAGAGGVGTLAIQIAKLLGAEVTTTASPRGEALVRRLGADHVIDYTTTDLATVETRFDGICDLRGGETLEKCLTLGKPGATVVSVAGKPEPAGARASLNPPLPLLGIIWLISRRLRGIARRHGVTYRFLFLTPNGKDVAELLAWVAAKKLELVIDQRFPLDQIAEAMAHMESGRAKGKILIEVG